MTQAIRAWLNGSRHYPTGVVLYTQAGGDTTLAALFAKGATPYTTKRLEKELLAMVQNVQPAPAPVVPPTSNQQPATTIQHPPADIQPPPTSNLYAACKAAANKLYKQAMNARAELFALARVENWEDVNEPNKMQQRAKLALEVVALYNKASAEYERAEYVQANGRLPDTDSETGQSEYDLLPDHQVKGALDNLRKNYSKMTKREPTPERVALLEKHLANIKKLEARWQSLK